MHHKIITSIRNRCFLFVISIISIFNAKISTAQEISTQANQSFWTNILPADSFLWLELLSVPLVTWVILFGIIALIATMLWLSAITIAMYASKRHQNYRGKAREDDNVQHIFRPDRVYGYHKHFQQ